MREKGLDCLLYLVHTDNLEGIMRQGILPYNSVRDLGLPHKSIANAEVQQRRNFYINGVPCHDFVPLYLVRRNPMLWAIGNEPRAYIRLPLEIPDEEDLIFADGNAASNSTGFVHGDFGARHLPWDVILATNWTRWWSWNEKRQRCSEVLVPHPITSDQFLDIRVDLSRQFSFPSDKREMLKHDPAFVGTGRLIGE
jgi:hypothetical protein